MSQMSLSAKLLTPISSMREFGRLLFSVCSLVRGVKILIEGLVHGEHVYSVRLEDCAHFVVASNPSLVIRLL